MTTEDLLKDSNFQVLKGSIKRASVDFEVAGSVQTTVSEERGSLIDYQVTVLIANRRTKAVVVKETIKIDSFNLKGDREKMVKHLCEGILFRVLGIGLTYLEEKMLMVGLIPKNELEEMVGE